MMQDANAKEAADARVRACVTTGTRIILIIGAVMTVMIALAFTTGAYEVTSETGVRALQTDFRVFWSAARLASQGDFLGTFDMERLGAVHNVVPDEWMPWLYPPGFLLLIAPLGTLSFASAFLVATIVSLVLIALAVRPFVGGSPVVWIGFALAPAYMPTLALGQNNLIWLAGLLAALCALRDGRYILAGIFLGCLTLKPQLGVMIPFALLAAGLWRTILAATVTAIILVAIPTAITGFEYWPLFVERMREQGEYMLGSIQTLDLMVGMLYLLVHMGVDLDVALWVQTGLSVISAASVFLVWRSDRPGFDVKAAVLLIAIFLSAPYLWYYEAAIMPMIGLFLVRSGILGRSLLPMLLLAVLWVGAGLLSVMVFFDFFGERFPWSTVNTPAVLTCLALCLWQLRSPGRTSGETA